MRHIFSNNTPTTYIYHLLQTTFTKAHFYDRLTACWKYEIKSSGPHLPMQNKNEH